MATTSLPRHEAERTALLVQKYVDAGYKFGAMPSAVQHAGIEAVKLGWVVTAKAFVSRYGVARDVYGFIASAERPFRGAPAEAQASGAPAVEETPEGRRETRDAAFWRRQARAAQRSLAEAEHVAAELGGVRQTGITVPDWLIQPSEERHRSVVGLLLSDVHAGEVVDADETLNLNAYNVDICRARLRRLFSATCQIPQRWISDCRNQGAFLALGGDLISGSIHEELAQTNALTSHEQVRLVVEEVTAGIRHMLDAYGRVHVASVPGNHGRTTVKPTAKLYARLSYDTLAATMIRDRFEGDDRVTFQIDSAPDAIVPVFGHTVFLTHGDKIGTGGGAGFAGPVLPIVRGTKKVEAQQARAGRRPDLILMGHFHTSSNPGPVLSNGSVVGVSEYSTGIRASVEPPQQWLFLLHEKWLLRERVEVRLEEPAIPERPRVRVPAGWQVTP